MAGAEGDPLNLLAQARLPQGCGRLAGHRSPVQVIARGSRRPLGRGSGVLREPGKAEPHAALLRKPCSLAGRDDGGLL